MAKHLIDLNEALRRATGNRDRHITRALDVLGQADLGDRSDAWR